MPSTISTLSSTTFDAWLADQNPFATSDAVCLFDLTEVRFVSPAALVQLAAACYALARDGRSPVIAVGSDVVRSYLTRAGFAGAVMSVARFKPPISAAASARYSHLYGSNPMLIEVTKIESGQALPDVLDRVVDTLRGRLKYRKYDAFDIATAVSEICQNSFDHNADTCGFLAMQVYDPKDENPKGKRFLEIGVADYGDGLAATLRRNPTNPPLGSDIEAILLATKPGTSEYDDQTRGTGLYHLLEIAYKHSGLVQIRSGAAKVRFRMDRKAGWGFTVPRMPGVQITLALPRKQP